MIAATGVQYCDDKLVPDFIISTYSIVVLVGEEHLLSRTILLQRTVCPPRASCQRNSSKYTVTSILLRTVALAW